MKEIELKFTRSYLLNINNKIRSLCGNQLEVVIYNDITQNPTMSLYDNDANPDFIICLNYTSLRIEKDCISSISCKINDDYSLEFSSKTNSIHEGNKYNLLLRSVLIILCPHIKIKIHDTHKYKSITNIISRAINPISIYLLAKYFHAENELLTDYMNANDLEYDHLTFDNITDFYENVDPMMDLDDEAMDTYMKNNKNFGNPILLTIDLVNSSNITQALKIFNNVVIKCPHLGGKTKRHKYKRRKTKRHKTKRYKKLKH